jgi:hypothetical protein
MVKFFMAELRFLNPSVRIVLLILGLIITTYSYAVENTQHSCMPAVLSRISNDLGFLKTTSPQQSHQPHSHSATICWANPTAIWEGLFHRSVQKASLKALVQQRAPLLATCPRLKYGCRNHNTVRFAGANANNEILRNNEDDDVSTVQDDESEEDVPDELDELDSDFDGYEDATVFERYFQFPNSSVLRKF